jgi:hypothetical protein
MTILDQFREEPLPPSRVDVPAAIRAGRRRQRARVGAAALGAVVVLAAGTATAPQALRLLSSQAGNGGGQPAISCGGLGPLADDLPTTPSGEAPAQFDPLRRWVDAGDVAGYRVESYLTARAWQRLELKTPSEDRMVEVTLYAKDGIPDFESEPRPAPGTLDPTTGTPAGRVHGVDAWWLPGRQLLAQFEVARLGWQWAPGAWAFVAAGDTPYDRPSNPPLTERQIDQFRAVAQAAARALRIGAGDPVRSPFTMPMPDCTRLTSTFLYESTTRPDGEPVTRVTLNFGVAGSDDASPLLQPRDGQTVSVTADSVATPESKPGSATATVDGHPAYSDGDFLVVYGVDGFAFELSCPGGQDAVRELFRTVDIGPGVTDAPGTWTDKPLQR